MIEKRMFGNTGFEVSRIGISSSFGATSAVYEEAFERGCNYFTWGTFIKGRSAEFKGFVKHMVASGKREKLFIGLLSYSHSAFLGNRFLISAMRQLGLEYIDGLILGYYSRKPSQPIVDWTLELKRKGIVRAIGMTTHNRSVVVPLAKDGMLDFFHIRYNAVHRGAENDIFPFIQEMGPGLVTFTATSWRQLLAQRKMPPEISAPSAADCYRFVLSRPEVDVCMMGVRNRDMLRENLGAIENGIMAAEELEKMKMIGDYLYTKPRKT
jgi:aryl-alcohol dehydrogenase-like predicted oxidoreductase